MAWSGRGGSISRRLVRSAPLAQLFGVGGGFAVVLALTLLLGLPAAEAVGTSLVIILINPAAGFAGHIGAAADLDYRIALTFTIGALITSVAAGRLAGRLSPQRVRHWFAWTALTLAPVVAAGALR